MKIFIVIVTGWMDVKMEEKARLKQDVNIIAIVIVNTTELFMAMALTAKANKMELEHTQLNLKDSVLAPVS